MNHKYKITGMACEGCVSNVQKTLSEINGIENVKVTLVPPQAELIMNHIIELKDLNAFLKKAGKYRLEELFDH